MKGIPARKEIDFLKIKIESEIFDLAFDVAHQNVLSLKIINNSIKYLSFWLVNISASPKVFNKGITFTAKYFSLFKLSY